MGSEINSGEGFLDKSAIDSSCLLDCPFFSEGYERREAVEAKLRYLKVIELCPERKEAGKGCIALSLDNPSYGATGSLGT